MSVLSSPQGSPERVWSLLSGLIALGGRAERPALDGLLNPGYLIDGQSLAVNKLLANDSHGVATSLDFLKLEGRTAEIDPELDARTPDEFADRIHDRLIGLKVGETDSALLETYAWVAVESDRTQGSGWLFERQRGDIVDQASVAVSGQDDGPAMNPTKWVAWRRWMVFLGLSTPLPIPNYPDLPDPTVRLKREIAREGLPDGTRLSAEDFLQIVARRMPYLDRGRLFSHYSGQMNHTPPARRLSPLLSAALSNLHGEALTLHVSGDSTGVYKLSGAEGLSPPAFDAITLGSGADA